MSIARWEKVDDHPGYRGMCEVMVKRAELTAGCRVLDVGTGTGIVPSVIEEHGPAGVAVTALDPDEGMLAFTRAHRKTVHATYRCGFEEMTGVVPERGFDRVFAANSLHLAESVPDAVRSVAAMLAPGGLFALLSGYFDGAVSASAVPVYAKVLRGAMKRMARAGVTGVRLDRFAAGRLQLNRADLRSWLGAAGFTTLAEEVLALSFDQELAEATVGSEMFASGVFTGVDPEVAGPALIESVREVASKVDLAGVRRDYLLVVARRDGGQTQGQENGR
ncbi:class I SAM-dependent methyltransferase [Amycolatopsis sp. NPDC021455]|uniref:class I SAM-dependent methyltransferase n=1 Tax=Amycolatopsis sp. NPDC021455 TaxID=3154901 RepID=UPI00340D0B89